MTLMADRPFAPRDLAAILERFNLPRAGAQPPDAVASAQLELVLGRIVALTDALRAADGDETARLAMRMLVTDLGFVAAQFRARANEVSASLSGVLDGTETAQEPGSGDG